MNGARARSGEEGFTLVETLIATFLISATLAMTYQGVANAAATARAVTDRREAVLVAQSVLARARVPLGIASPTALGAEGRWTWRIATAPFLNAPDSTMRLEKVTVTVIEARSGRSMVRLSSLRLAP